MATEQDDFLISVTAEVRKADTPLTSLLKLLNQVEGKAKGVSDALAEAGGKGGIEKLIANVGRLQAALASLKTGNIDSALRGAQIQGQANSVYNQYRSPIDAVVNAAKRIKEERNRATDTLFQDAVGADKLAATKDVGALKLREQALTKALREQTKAFEVEGDAGRKSIIANNMATLQARLAGIRDTLSADKAEAEAFKERIRVNQAKVRELVKVGKDEEAASQALMKERVKTARDAVRQRIQENPEYQRGQAQESWDKRMSVLNVNGGANLVALQGVLMLNYAALNKFSQGVSFATGFVHDFDASLTQLQAISGATHREMLNMAKSIIDISTATKFSVVEVTEAATTMAQAGFSTKEIQDALAGVTMLAAATGSTLAESVDVATSVIGVFSMSASEMGNVANTVTAALNMTKLTMEKFALGVQYAANIAAESGVSFVELTAALGAMANTGIKSGSTLGTGLRQIFLTLQDPPKKMKQRLDELGISLDKIDVKTQGFAGVLENLKRGGFTTADAMATMETRTAAAFTAISRGSDEMLKLQDALIVTNAATEANAVQMGSLKNIIDNLKDNFGALAVNMSSGLLPVIKSSLSALSGLLQVLNGFPGVLSFVGNALTALTAIAVYSWASKLLAGFVAIAGVKDAIVGTLAAIRTGAVATGGALTLTSGAAAATSVAFRALLATPAAGWFIALTAAMTLLPILLDAFKSKAELAADALDKLRARHNELKGEQDAVKAKIEAVGEAMGRATARSERLTEAGRDTGATNKELSALIKEANVRFGELGYSVDIATGTLHDHLEALKAVNDELERDRGKVMTDRLSAMKAELDGINRSLKELDTTGLLKADTDITKGKRGFFGQTGALLKGALVTGASTLMTGGLLPGSGDMLNQSLNNSLARNEPNLGQKYLDLINSRMLNTKFQAYEAEAQRLQNILDKAGDEFNGSRRALLEGAIEQLRTIAGKLKEKQAKETESNNLNVEIAKYKFSTDAIIKPMLDLVTKDGQDALTKLADQITKADNQDAAADAQIKANNLLTSFKDARETVAARLAELVASDSDVFAQQAAKELLNSIDNVIAETKSNQKSAEGKANDARQSLLELLLEMMERDFAELTEKLKSAVEADKPAISASIDHLRKSILATAQALAENEADANPTLRTSPELKKSFVSGKVAEKGRSLDKSSDRGRDKLESAAKKAEEAWLSYLEKSIKDLGNVVTNEGYDTMRGRIGVLKEQASGFVDKAVDAYRKSLTVDKEFAAALGPDRINAMVEQRRLELSRDISETQGKIISGLIDAVKRNIEDFKDAFEIGMKEVQRTFDTKMSEIDHAAKMLVAKTSGQSTIAGENNTTDADKFLVRQAEEELTVLNLRKEIAALDERILGMRVNIDSKAREEAEYAQIIKDLEEERAALMGNASMPEEAQKRAVADIELKLRDLQRDRNSLLQEEKDLQLNLKQIEDQRAEQQAKLVSYTKDANSENLSLTDRLNAAFQMVIAQGGGLKTLNSQLVELASGGLKSARDGLATFFKDVLTGSETAGSAFKKLGLTIINAMLDIVTSQAATMFLKLIFSAFGGSMGGAFNFSGSVGTGTGGLYAQGGEIRRAGGGVLPQLTAGLIKGMDFGRDSVNLVGRPGEFVLQKSAVDSVGVDFLNKMNLQGDKALGAAGANIVAPTMTQAAPVNVYVVAPEERPTLGPNDVLAIVAKDIATNGTTKKLIAQVRT